MTTLCSFLGAPVILAIWLSQPQLSCLRQDDGGRARRDILSPDFFHFIKKSRVCKTLKQPLALVSSPELDDTPLATRGG